MFVLILGTDILAKTFWHRFFISMTFRHIDLWALWTFLQMVVSVDLLAFSLHGIFDTVNCKLEHSWGLKVHIPKCPCQNISCQNFRCWNDPKPTTTKEKLRAYCPNMKYFGRNWVFNNLIKYQNEFMVRNKKVQIPYNIFRRGQHLFSSIYWS